MKKELTLPQFKDEDEERDFWAKIDLADYFEPSDFEPVSFPNLKPSTTTISLRLPASLLANLKSLANARDVPYQSLMKIMLAEKVEEMTSRSHLPRSSQASQSMTVADKPKK